MVAPGTAVREGIDNIVHARTGGLIVIGDPDELAFLFSGGIKLDIDYSPALLYQLAKMDGAIALNGQRDEDRVVQRAADAGPDDPHVGDRHAPPHRRARVQADRRAGDRGLAAARRRLALRRRRQVHPRGDPGGARQGQPGAGDARQVPLPARPGLHPPDGARVRGRRDAARRAHRPAARRAGDAHGGRDRALHRRARHRGPADRDAARGDDGRRRRRQGGAAARLPRRAGRGPVRAARSTASPGCRTRTCSTSAGWPRSWATTARSTHSTIPSRRGASASSAASRGCRSSWCRTSSASSAGWTRSSPRPTPSSESVDGVGEIRAKDIREGLRRLQEINLVDRYLQT